MPNAREVREGSADYLAGPLERVAARRLVECARRSCGQAGPFSAGLGRTLVEVPSVPGGGESLELTTQLRPGASDGRSLCRTGRLRVGLVGRQSERDGEPLLWDGDAPAYRVAVRVERRLRLWLIVTGLQSTVATRS